MSSSAVVLQGTSSLVARSLSQPASAQRSENSPLRDNAQGSQVETSSKSRTVNESGPSQRGLAKSGREWRHFAAGGCGGMMGALITCPLEVVKTHLQSKNVVRRSLGEVVLQISRNDGVLGFWRGIGPMLAGVVPARALNFWTYNAVKGHLLSAGYAEGPLVHVAGSTTSTATTPAPCPCPCSCS